MELPPDDVMVAGLRDGDERIFALLLDAWCPGMMRLARSFVSTRASAEEVTQETWLAVVRGIDGFQGRSSLKTWVYRILVNTAKGRGGKESRTLPFASLAAGDSAPTVDPSRFRDSGDPHPRHWVAEREPRPWQLPEEQALRREVQGVISDALELLPQRLRTVITMRDVEGYSSTEVCDLLEISPGNQRVLLHRARAAVRRELEHYFSAVSDGERR